MTDTKAVPAPALPLLALLLPVLAFAIPIMTVDEVKPGMKGVGWSVFSGTKPEQFQVEVVDVMRKVSPRGDLILCRLSGAGLEKSGVIAGMSGSPVYIDGKLLGAVAYAWGFAKEPLAGVTPIAEMLKIWDTPSGGKGKNSGAPRGGINHLPIPVAISGLSPLLEEIISPTLNSWGMMPCALTSASGKVDTADLVPGGVVGVALLDGDVRAAAVGTITHRAGNKIIGFGHPFFLAGDVELPMTGGVIHSVMPSLATSFKIFSPGPPIGTITQDRYCGIAGTIGTPAPMLPVTVRVHSPVARDTYHFRTARHDQLTPLLIPIGIVDVALQTEGTLEEATLFSRLRLIFRDGQQTEIKHTFAGVNPIARLYEQTQAELKLLFENEFQPVELTRVEMELNFTLERNTATLIAAITDRIRAKPGDTINIRLRLRTYRGEETEKTVSIPLPAATPPGTVYITISSRDEFLAGEANRAPLLIKPNSLEQLLQLVAESGQEDELLIAGYTTRPGLTVASQELPQVPPSLRQLFSSEIKGGSVQPTGSSLLFKIPVNLGRVVTGSARLELEVNK